MTVIATAAPAAPVPAPTDNMVGSVLSYERIVGTEPGKRIVDLLQKYDVEPADAVRIMLNVGDLYTMGEQAGLQEGVKLAAAPVPPVPAMPAAALPAAVGEPLSAVAAAAGEPKSGVMSPVGALTTQPQTQLMWLLGIAAGSPDGIFTLNEHKDAFKAQWAKTEIHQPVGTLVERKLLTRLDVGRYQITPLGTAVQTGKKPMMGSKKKKAAKPKPAAAAKPLTKLPPPGKKDDQRVAASPAKRETQKDIITRVARANAGKITTAQADEAGKAAGHTGTMTPALSEMVTKNILKRTGHGQYELVV